MCVGNKSACVRAYFPVAITNMGKRRAHMASQCVRETIRVPAGQRLRSVKKEYHVRRQGGRIVAYILRDIVAQEHVLLSQKLTYLARYVTNSIADQPVSLSALFKTITKGRLAKCRWAIEQVDLENAPQRFEEMRGEYRDAVVLGSPECYQIP